MPIILHLMGDMGLSSRDTNNKNSSNPPTHPYPSTNPNHSHPHQSPAHPLHSCVAGLVDKPVTIKNIEYSIVERAWEEGWITPRIPQYRSGMSVAVVGSGPSGTV